MRTLITILITVLLTTSCAAQNLEKLSKNTDGSITILNNSAERNAVFISADGKMGIGKRNPTDKLEVNGQIHAKSVKVDLEKWADIVFEKEYKLPRLREIENFIAQYGHLPEIPSAEKVIQEGIELGEMNRLLLKKIEELTLHLIAKEKQIEHLAEDLEQLKKEVNAVNAKN